MRINTFIKKRPYLVWYTKNYDHLSPESIVEAVLNYGNWEDVQGLIKIMGIKKTAKVFKKQIERKRINYDPMTVNYFVLYFRKHAQIKIKTPENIQWKLCACGGLR